MAEKHISEDKSESSEKRESPGSKKSKILRTAQGSSSISREKKTERKTPVKKAGVKVYVRSSSSKKEKNQ